MREEHTPPPENPTVGRPYLKQKKNEKKILIYLRLFQKLLCRTSKLQCKLYLSGEVEQSTHARQESCTNWRHNYGDVTATSAH